jgi:hypothetical protein
MPVSYIVDAARRAVLTTMTDVVTVSDLEAFVATLGADPRFEPTFRHLFDCRYIAQVDVSGDDMRRLVTNHLVRSGTRRAIVVDDPTIFGMARMFQTLRELEDDEGVHIFRSLADARAWLGLVD